MINTLIPDSTSEYMTQRPNFNLFCIILRNSKLKLKDLIVFIKSFHRFQRNIKNNKNFILIALYINDLNIMFINFQLKKTH